MYIKTIKNYLEMPDYILKYSNDYAICCYELFSNPVSDELSLDMCAFLKYIMSFLPKSSLQYCYQFHNETATLFAKKRTLKSAIAQSTELEKTYFKIENNNRIYTIETGRVSNPTELENIVGKLLLMHTFQNFFIYQEKKGSLILNKENIDKTFQCDVAFGYTLLLNNIRKNVEKIYLLDSDIEHGEFRVFELSPVSEV